MIGPFDTIDLGAGRSVDLYLLRFAKDGALLSPRTRDIILDKAAGCSDIFVFSHGWNNTFDRAARAYRQFIQGYASQRARLGLPVGANYRPMLVGVIWPSTSLVLPWEQGPTIAAPADADVEEREELLHLFGESLDADAYAGLAELVDGVVRLDGVQARRAADLVAQSLEPGEGADDPASGPEGADLLAAWQVLEHGSAPPQPVRGHGTAVIPGLTPPTTDQPLTAGGQSLDPRGLLRLGSVWKMKVRAGKVGANGVAPVLARLLDSSNAKVHLIGHSYGARVVLSAAVTLAPTSREVHSLLLLQPAVNRWCFADEVIGKNAPGGYRPVLDKVVRPIVTTMSPHDVPLHEAFHLAVRDASLGEPVIAAFGDTDRYGALGGYGPKGVQANAIPALREGISYGLDEVDGIQVVDGGVNEVKVRGVDPDPEAPAISGHGDVNSTVTWWILHSLAGS